MTFAADPAQPGPPSPTAAETRRGRRSAARGSVVLFLAAAVLLTGIVAIQSRKQGPAGIYFQLEGDRDAALEAMNGVDLVWRTQQGELPRPGIAGQTLAFDPATLTWGIRVRLLHNTSEEEQSAIVESATAYPAVQEFVFVEEGALWPDCAPNDGCDPVTAVCRTWICAIFN